MRRNFFLGVIFSYRKVFKNFTIRMVAYFVLSIFLSSILPSSTPGWS